MRNLWQNAPGILIDFLLILGAYLLREPLLDFSRRFLVPATITAQLLQILAFGASALLMFARTEERERSALQTAVYGACLLVVVFGPQWVHIPRGAMEVLGLEGFGAQVSRGLFLGVYAAQIFLWVQIASNGADIRAWFDARIGGSGERSEWLLRALCLPLIALFLLATEALILSALALDPPAADELWKPIALLVAAYLPVRLFLVFRPPFAWLEFASALFAFYVFLSAGRLVPALF